MPQLNPTPWLTILLFSWLIFLTVIPPKIMSHTFTNDITLSTKNLKSTPWDWLWY